MSEVSIAKIILAAFPILVIVLLMLAAKWSAARAGLVGLGLAWGIAWKGFGYGDRVHGEIGPVVATGGVFAEAVFTAATILWIIFPALCIYQLQVRTGAIDVLRQAMGQLSPDPRLVAVMVAWFFALFIEGAAGFGTTVALAAPFLVSLGFQPVEAVTMALIGHSVGVSFGAVGTPIVPQSAATGLSEQALAQANGLYHSLLGWVMLIAVMGIISKGVQKEGIVTQPIWGWTALAAALFLLPYFVLSRWVGPELPTLGGSLIGGLGFIAALSFTRWRRTRRAATTFGQPSLHQATTVLRAAAPYLFLVGLILLTRLFIPVKQLLTGLTWEWSWLSLFRGKIQPLYHPGTMLALAFLLGACWQRATYANVKTALGRAARQLGPVTIALVAMLGLSRLMVHAGMIDSLASAAARTAGNAWPFGAPFVGVLGTFVTGSATASNILFIEFQQATAKTLGLPVLTMAGAQGFGAAVGNIICPHNIIAGGATVGLSGQEGAILRRTLGVCLIYAILGGLLTLLITR